jgi:dTMP kinase
MMIGIEPDLTFIIDMDPGEALARGLARKSGEDRFEDMGAAFQVKLREGFLALASAAPDRCHLVNGHRDADAIGHDIAMLTDMAK